MDGAPAEPFTGITLWLSARFYETTPELHFIHSKFGEIVIDVNSYLLLDYI